MAILNNLISSLRSTKKQKRELQGHMNQTPRAKKTIQSFDDLSLKEKNLLNKLNSSQNPHDFKSQLSKINSLAALEKIKPFINEFKENTEQGMHWVDNAYNNLLFQKIMRSGQINEETFETLEKLNQEDKIVKVFLEKDFGPLREKALQKLKTQKSLIKLAKKVNSAKWGLKIIDFISDPDTLLELSKNASHKKVRLFAKEKRESLFKDGVDRSSSNGPQNSQNLKLIKEKLKNFMAHYSETKAEDFLNEMSKAFQKEKANSEGNEESLTKTLMDIENNLKLIEEQINLTKKREACLIKASHMLEDYEKRLTNGEKISQKHSQEIQSQWDELSWSTIELSKREDFNKRFFLLIDKMTDKELDKKIIDREKIINKLESYLAPLSSFKTTTFENESEWEDFFRKWKHLEKEWEYATKGKIDQQSIPSQLNDMKFDLDQFVEQNKKKYKKLTSKPQKPRNQNFYQLDPMKLLERLESCLKTTNSNKFIYKDVIKIRSQWENILKSSKKPSEEIQQKVESLLKIFFEQQDKFLQEKEWENFSNQRKRKEILEALKELIASGSIQALGNKLKDFQRDWKSLKHQKGKETTNSNDEFNNLIKKGAQLCIDDKKRIFEKLKEVFKEEEHLFPIDKDLSHKNDKDPLPTSDDSSNSRTVLSKPFINDKLEAVKELQKSFTLSGPLPTNMGEDIVQSFQKQCQFFFDQRKLHFSYSEEKKKENYKIKLEIFEKTKELIKKEKALHEGDNVKKIISLQKEWKTIGPVPADKQDELWNNFQDICHDFFHYLDQQKQGNQVRKEKICNEMKKLTEDLDETTHFKDLAQKVKDLQKEWKSIGPLPKEVDDTLWKTFRGYCDTFFDLRDKFLKERQSLYQKNEQLKKELLKELDEIEKLVSWKEKTDKVINIQKEWKKIGPTPKSSEKEIWHEFKTRCDRFFTQKKSFFNEQNEAKIENLQLKEDICLQLEAIYKLAFPEKEETLVNDSPNIAKQLDWGLRLKPEIIIPGDQNKTQRNAIHKVIELQKEWKTIGRVPKDQEETLWLRFRSLAGLFFSNSK